MDNTLFITILSVIAVSAISLIGLFLIPLSNTTGRRVFSFLISFSAGALLGDVFIHLLPELAEEDHFNLNTSLYILGAILVFFFLEKYLHWHHHHGEGEEQDHANDAHPFVYNILFGDFIHNFIDGLVIAGAYQLDFKLGVATTVAVILHEIPQEIGDFGVLIYGGFTKAKALIYNAISAAGSLLGVGVAYIFADTENILPLLAALGAGSFIYIATADLIPQIHKEHNRPYSQLAGIVLGIASMALLMYLE